MNEIIKSPHAILETVSGTEPGTRTRPSGLASHAISEAETVVRKLKADDDLAQEIGDERLIELTSGRREKGEKLWSGFQAAIDALAEGEKAYDAAYNFLCAAEARREAGSLDSAEALTIAKENEIAAAAERVHRHRMPGLKSAATGHLARLRQMSNDEDAKRRDEQAKNATAFAGRLFDKYQSAGEVQDSAGKLGATMTAADAAWAPLGDEIARREFKARLKEVVKSAKDYDVKVPDAGDFDRVVAARVAGYTRACAEARTRLASISGGT